MKEYWFENFGFFSEETCKKIKEKLDGKSFMKFEVIYSNCAGNCTIGVKTAHKDKENTIRNFFLYCLISELTRS